LLIYFFDDTRPGDGRLTGRWRLGGGALDGRGIIRFRHTVYTRITNIVSRTNYRIWRSIRMGMESGLL